MNARLQRILVVSHIDVSKRPLHIVRQELWDAAAEHLSHEILDKGYSGREAVPVIREQWPRVAYSILKKSPSFEYSKKKFLALPFNIQQTLAGPTRGLFDLLKAVENKIELLNHAVRTSGSEGVVV